VSLQLSRVSDAKPAATVLIVGTGPAGLFGASEFIRRGVKPRIVERRLVPHHEARGTAQPATLDIINRVGHRAIIFGRAVASWQVELLGPGIPEISITKFASIGCRHEFHRPERALLLATS
jgi:2-polyprenyl-6-methoxyphenol hydroxylase-like FAD-dependent oxidoreductase